MFNIFKKVKNKVNTSEKDYSLSYDNLAIPEIHKKDSGSEEDDADISSNVLCDMESVRKEQKIMQEKLLYLQVKSELKAAKSGKKP